MKLPERFTPTEIDVKLRRMRFALDGEVPKHWARGNKFLTHFFNSMSAVFPEGEKFFIDAVRHYEDQIDDAELRAQIRGFLAQEGHHTFQHRLMNALITRSGIDMSRHEAWTEQLLDRSTPGARPKNASASPARSSTSPRSSATSCSRIRRRSRTSTNV